jgi:NitT/TauT family transport system ATP-binding protein/nitrate/nitrite transport system substrate-binding protein
MVRLGFVPLSDSAPLIVAQEKGFFAGEGLSVALSREVSWATVRDKVAVGALDAAHMLAPMTLACTLGAGGEPAAMIAPLALNRNGAAVTLAAGLLGGRPAGAAAARELARVIAERRAAGAPPLRFAVVFPYSMHNYLLRYWLAQAGVDPDRDVAITVAPPSRMAARLALGELDGFCAGEPWNLLAERERAGFVAVRAAEIWRDGPEKVFGLRADWAEAHPERLQALLRALLRAAAWADAPENRAELAGLLARPEYVGVDARLVEASLDHILFHGRGANAPLPVHAGWLLSQMMRWGQIPREIDIRATAERVCRLDLYNQAATSLGRPAATASQIADGFADGSVFRMGEARAYAESFPLSRLARA